ncbi:hypothetical protein ACTOB_005141 [Actinoplanes oblitus]|uniref:Secreted protein n=1 Tax=Actinoplanes oblitus TaxID=3040509 RepID=A0ABY8W5P6_9ACTN|nr:hypothetical protein [Actinoplanes oblitus]WIM93171.1 hypothetical protein ACTOB_005141 [Actinoplanes oblitus]
MNKIAIGALGALAGAGSVLAMTSPAAAAGNTIDLAAGGATAYGSYNLMMSIPERPVPPIKVDGTLAMNQRGQCAVVQIAGNGPADGIEWRTLTSLCHPGKTNFAATSGYLWGGFQPELRLCVGATVKRAERGHDCDVHVPTADS